jgi:hypothetical protein
MVREDLRLVGKHLLFAHVDSLKCEVGSEKC